MEQGWLYVLINPSLPGLVKVGRTTRLPSTRVAELSQATGVVTPFLLVLEQPFSDCVRAERDIHRILDRCGMRVTSNREFFRATTTEIVRTVLYYADEQGERDPSIAPQSGAQLLQEGDEHLFAEGESRQDLCAALRCYQLSASRGSIIAFERLAAICSQTRGATRLGRKAVMANLQEGARRGNYYCYGEMAAIAAEEGNVAEFMMAWDAFFLHRQGAWRAEAEEGPRRYPTALRRYVVTCFALGLSPNHLPELRTEADALIRVMRDGIESELQSPFSRRLLAAAVTWAKQTLMDVPGGRRRPALLGHLVPLPGYLPDAAA